MIVGMICVILMFSTVLGFGIRQQPVQRLQLAAHGGDLLVQQFHLRQCGGGNFLFLGQSRGGSGGGRGSSRSSKAGE